MQFAQCPHNPKPAKSSTLFQGWIPISCMQKFPDPFRNSIHKLGDTSMAEHLLLSGFEHLSASIQLAIFFWSWICVSLRSLHVSSWLPGPEVELQKSRERVRKTEWLLCRSSEQRSRSRAEVLADQHGTSMNRNELTTAFSYHLQSFPQPPVTQVFWEKWI